MLMLCIFMISGTWLSGTVVTMLFCHVIDIKLYGEVVNYRNQLHARLVFSVLWFISMPILLHTIYKEHKKEKEGENYVG